MSSPAEPDEGVAADPDAHAPDTHAPDTHALGAGTPDKEWWREAVTMALYVSLSLLAVLVALPPGTTLSESHLAFTVLLTAISLLLAHQVAFRLSTRLVNQGNLDAQGARLLAAQAVGGLAVAVTATTPIILLGREGMRLTELLLLAFVAATGYRAARSRPASRLRALGYVCVIAAAVLLVLLLKSLAEH